jgi:hypothetical protein
MAIEEYVCRPGFGFGNSKAGQVLENYCSSRPIYIWSYVREVLSLFPVIWPALEFLNMI